MSKEPKQQPATLEEAIRESGLSWVIDWFAPRSEAVEHLKTTLESVNQLGRNRLGDRAPNLSESAILRQYSQNPLQVRGFFQALGGTRTPAMLLMVWRVIQGMEIKELEIAYHRQQDFTLRVILESPYGEEDEVYESMSIQDFALLRHVGILEISGTPVFDGFYALKA